MVKVCVCGECARGGVRGGRMGRCFVCTVCSTKSPISEWQEYMDIKTHFKTFLVLDSCLELQKVSGG